MADKRYDSLKIENVVASGVIAESIDLNEVSSKIKSCELNTKRFPGAVYRIENPKIASLIFSSGKVVLTGIRDDKALKDGLAIIIKSLKEAGRQKRWTSPGWQLPISSAPMISASTSTSTRSLSPSISRTSRIRTRTVPGPCVPDQGPKNCRTPLLFGKDHPNRREKPRRYQKRP